MRMPPSRATAVVVGLCSVATLIEVATGQTDLLASLGGFIPARVGGAAAAAGALPVWLTPLSATLLHSGLLHLVFNMLMLGYCGKAVEAVLGRTGLVVLVLVGAYAAAAGQYALSPHSPIPMIGASGAASAVVAAYAFFYGTRKPMSAHPRLDRALHVLWLAAGWIGVQLLVGLATGGGDMPIAVGAHIGGFLIGLALAQPLLRWRYRKA